MRLKHNKKRNTAFLFECLIKEVAKSAMNKDEPKRKQVLALIREHFSLKSVLGKELALYRTLYETKDVNAYSATQIIAEAKYRHSLLDRKDIFNAQTKLIDSINKKLGKEVWNNFVPNYKSLATVHQIFSDSCNIKTKVILENKIWTWMVSDQTKKIEKDIVPVDNIALNSFINDFNQKYSDSLLEEQKKLISSYIVSLNEETELDFKLFVNDEINRINKVIKEFNESNPSHEESTRLKEAIGLIDSFKKRELTEKDLKLVLKLQRLCEEIKTCQ